MGLIVLQGQRPYKNSSLPKAYESELHQFT